MPKPDWIPATPGSIPPSGWLLVEETPSGDKCWVDPKSLKQGEPRSELTEYQIRRVLRLRAVLAEHDTLTLAAWIDNLRRDSDPELEITVWERIADLYKEELGYRHGSDANERENLFFVLVTASTLPTEDCTTDNIVLMHPSARGLPRLAEVVEGYRLGG